MIDEELKITNWNAGYRTVVTCINCNTVAYSTYPGEFSSCDCGDIYVDETLHYCRRGGECGVQTIEQLNELNYYLIYAIMQDFFDLGVID